MWRGVVGQVDMTNIMALRNRHKDAFEKKHGVKLGFMSAFIKASAASLKEIPAVNAGREPWGVGPKPRMLVLLLEGVRCGFGLVVIVVCGSELV